MKLHLKQIALKMKRFFFSKLDLYFLKELIPNYGFGLVFFSALIMLQELFYLARFYFEYNFPLDQVLLLFLNLIPFLLSFSIPFAVLPAYLLTMGRWSSDSEIIALRSCGVSTLRIIRPGLVFAILIVIFAFFFKDLIEIPANYKYVQLKAKLSSQKPAVELKERQFLELGGYKINFSRMEQYGQMTVLYDIYLVDIVNRSTIKAEKGRIFTDPEDPEHYILKFMNGTISEVIKVQNDEGQIEEHYFIASFKYMAINRIIPIPPEFYTKGPETMTVKELTKDIQMRSSNALMNIAMNNQNIENLKIEIKKLWERFNQEKGDKSLDEIEKLKQQYKDLENSLRNQIKNYKSSIADYRKNLPNYHIYKYYEKFSMPLSAFVFAFICLSLGIYIARTGRNEGLGISIVIMLMFFGFKTGLDNLVYKNSLPPIVAWAPDTVFFLIGLVLFLQKVRE